KGLSLPGGQLYTWVALEKSLTRQAKRLLVDEKGVKEELIKAVAYWRLDPHDDE
ncbi:siderophore-interacting protein, partial [Pseudomonas frederiksbergensis]|nr:siderophore-interacting protein [Pseudomonas frederiksbergensis]